MDINVSQIIMWMKYEIIQKNGYCINKICDIWFTIIVTQLQVGS